MKKMFKIFIIILVLVFGLKTLLFITFPVQHKEIVYKYSTEFNLDPFLVLSIIKVESNFNENAISSKNARGLMQIGETTAKWAAEELKIEDFRIEDLFDPEINILIGTWYMNNLLNQFGNTEVALAAYNAGSGNVTNWLNNNDYSFDSTTLYRIPFDETENYVRKVSENFRIYERLYDEEIFKSNISLSEKLSDRIHSFILAKRKGNIN